MIKDIIFQIYAGQKCKKMIDLVLNNFISEYEKLNLDYALPISNLDNTLTQKKKWLVTLSKKKIDQTFYWSQVHNNPNRIMVGAIITDDDKLIMSLTFDVDKEIEKKYFNKLKCILNSEIGIISYVNPTEYENGKDFVLKYV